MNSRERWVGTHPAGSAFHSLHDLFGAVLEVVGGDYVEAGGGDDLLALLDIGAFETHHQRHLEADLFHRGDHALGDHITAHDTAEDVDEDALDLRVGGDDLERLGDLFLGRPAAHVEKVGRLCAVELDDVHGGHRQTRAVDHAADLAVEGDIVEVVFRGFQFLGVLFGRVAQLGDVRVAIHRVRVKAHLGVETFQIALVGDDERVDLEHLHVFFDEHLVERAHQRDALLDLPAGEAEVEGDAAAVERLIAGGGINREAEDLFWGGGCDLLDIHAALGGGDEADAGGAAIHEQGEIHLGLDARAVLDIDAVDLLACRPGLLGHEGAAEHPARLLGGLLDGFGKAHAARLAGAGLLERALAASARVNLRLDDPERAVERARGGLGLFAAQDHATIRHRCAKRAQERLGLILVDIHETVPFCCDYHRYRHRFARALNGFLRFPGNSGKFRGFVITAVNRVITGAAAGKICAVKRIGAGKNPDPAISWRSCLSRKRRVDPLAGVDEALDRV